MAPTAASLRQDGQTCGREETQTETGGGGMNAQGNSLAGLDVDNTTQLHRQAVYIPRWIHNI